MGVKAGVDPKIMIEVINAGTGRNSATVDKFPRSILTGTFNHGFATGLLHKDVRLCVDEAEALGVPMVLGAARAPDSRHHQRQIRPGLPTSPRSPS